MSARKPCRYHNSRSALWHCHSCQLNCCDKCVVYAKDGGYPSCVLCRRSMTQLSQASVIPSLSKHMSVLFAQCLQFPILTLSLIFAVLLSLFPAGNVGAVLTLLMMMPLFESGLNLLEKFSANEPGALQITKLLKSESHWIFVKLTAFYFLSLLILAKLLNWSPAIGSLSVILFAVSIPASFAILVMEKSLINMFQPAKIFYIIKLLGVEYFLIYVQLLAVVTLVIMVNPGAGQTVSSGAKVIALLVSIWLFYFAMISLGHLIHRYHVEFNYASGRESRIANSRAQSVKQGLFFEIDIYLHEGRMEDAKSKLLALCRLPTPNYEALEKLIKLLLVEDNIKQADVFSAQYFALMEKRNQMAQAAAFYKSLSESGFELSIAEPQQLLKIAEYLANKSSWALAQKLCGSDEVRPETDKPWQQLALLRARIAMEFEKNYKKTEALLLAIQKYSFDEDILAKVSQLEALLIKIK